MISFFSFLSNFSFFRLFVYIFIPLGEPFNLINSFVCLSVCLFILWSLASYFLLAIKFNHFLFQKIRNATFEIWLILKPYSVLKNRVFKSIQIKKYSVNNQCRAKINWISNFQFNVILGSRTTGQWTSSRESVHLKKWKNEKTFFCKT